MKRTGERFRSVLVRMKGMERSLAASSSLPDRVRAGRTLACILDRALSRDVLPAQARLRRRGHRLLADFIGEIVLALLFLLYAGGRLLFRNRPDGRMLRHGLSSQAPVSGSEKSDGRAVRPEPGEGP